MHKTGPGGCGDPAARPHQTHQSRGARRHSAPHRCTVPPPEVASAPVSRHCGGQTRKPPPARESASHALPCPEFARPPSRLVALRLRASPRHHEVPGDGVQVRGRPRIRAARQLHSGAQGAQRYIGLGGRRRRLLHRGGLRVASEVERLALVPHEAMPRVPREVLELRAEGVREDPADLEEGVVEEGLHAELQQPDARLRLAGLVRAEHHGVASRDAGVDGDDHVRRVHQDREEMHIDEGHLRVEVREGRSYAAARIEDLGVEERQHVGVDVPLAM
mmetsp:Transcript_99419/g.278418  ORF Transcript_99419/g.278418 Transcript_99419/m.278418 type:complete len:276 (-) Transcript_99419:260-1087(-)